MATAHIALLQELADMLLLSPAIADSRVSLHDLPMQPGHDSAIVLRLARSRGVQVALGENVTQWTTQVQVVCKQRAAAGEDPTTAVDVLLQAAYARIVAQASPPNLGSWSAEAGIDWDIDEADTSIGVASIVLTATHLAATDLGAV